MLNTTSVNRFKQRSTAVSSRSLPGLTLSPLRPQSAIQYISVYGMTGNIVAQRPVLRSDSCAFSSNYNDILDPVHANQCTLPCHSQSNASVSSKFGK